jgi:hypothetical protein
MTEVMNGATTSDWVQTVRYEALIDSPELRPNSAATPPDWDALLGDELLRTRLNEGLADVAAGRTRPWSEIREALK